MVTRNSIRLAVCLTALCWYDTAVGAPGRTIDAPIKRVTVFQDQARITREISLDLPSGDNVLQIEQLPQLADEQSFRASASGVTGITIRALSVKSVEHTERPQSNAADLERQIALIERGQKRILNDRLAAYNGQKEILSAISSKAGEQMAGQVGKGNLSTAQWDATLQFIGSRTQRIGDSVRLVEVQLEDVGKQIDKLRADLANLAQPITKRTRTVTVNLDLKTAGKATLTLEYIMPRASWKPLYDARLIDDSGHIELSYNAEISQQTGEDWTDVELTLSTATPSRGVGPGEFMPRYLSGYSTEEMELANVIRVTASQDILNKFETSSQSTITAQAIKTRPVQTVDNLLKSVANAQTTSSGQVYVRGGRAGEADFVVDGVPVGDPLGGVSGTGLRLDATLANYSTADITSQSRTVTFKVPRKESVPAGEPTVRTTIARWTLDGSLKLVSRPRNIEAAYRLVSIKNHESAPLLPGRVAIFAGSDYLGTAGLNQVIAPNQTFELPFGQDQTMSVKRTVEYKKSDGSDKTRLDYTVGITAVNHGKTGKIVQLEESVPVSRDNRVKITIGDILPKPESLDDAGKGKWTLTVAAGDSVVVKVPYRIAYPSGLDLSER